MKRFAALLFIIILAGCKVGPNYYPPNDSSMPTFYSEDRDDETFYPEEEDLVQWWERFDDPFLDSLLEEAVCGSFDYLIALEKVYQARAQYWNQFTMILPEFDFDFQATRSRTSQAFRPGNRPVVTRPISDFFQIGFDCIWELDFFGRLQMNADSAYDLWESAAESSRYVKITVLSEVANTYTLITAYQQKIAFTHEILAADDEQIALARDRMQSGLGSEQDLLLAISNHENNIAALKVLETSLKQSIYSLAILLGRAPETLLCDFSVNRPIPYAKGKVPAGVPADLLCRRPDIRSAERQMASATELVGVAWAQLYPSISLTGSTSSFAANPLQGANFGYSSDQINRLFTAPARVWGYGAILTVPVFDFGKRLAAVEVQVALQKQACLTYQKTVITALQEVEDALAAYFNEEEREKSLGVIVEVNKRNYDLILDLYESGLGDYSQLLLAKQQWLISLNNLTDSQQALATDMIAIYKSLGGDWSCF